MVRAFSVESACVPSYVCFKMHPAQRMLMIIKSSKKVFTKEIEKRLRRDLFQVAKHCTDEYNKQVMNVIKYLKNALGRIEPDV